MLGGWGRRTAELCQASPPSDPSCLASPDFTRNLPGDSHQRPSRKGFHVGTNCEWVYDQVLLKSMTRVFRQSLFCWEVGRESQRLVDPY